MAAGEAKSDLQWLGLVILLLGLGWFISGGPNNPEATTGPFIRPPERLDITTYNYNSVPTYSGYDTNSALPPDLRSAYFEQFSIDTGNARYETQANREYLAINYRGSVPVNVTGWYLTNGKSDRLYDTGGSNLERGVSDVIVLPRVRKLFIAGTQNLPDSDIVLMPNSRVVITTGSVPSNDPFPVNADFQTNICSGYIGRFTSLQLSPSLYGFCPAPTSWPGAEAVGGECYRYIKNLSSCHTPDFEERMDGNVYVDGRLDFLTSSCREVVKRNFNYNGCVAAFANRADFYQPEWRIFLKRPWELWANERETVTLHDRDGKVVTQLKY